MNIIIKSTAEIEKIRYAGKLAAEVLEMIAPHIQAGVTTLELNDLCHHHIVEVQKAVPAPLNYRGFPKSVCTSVNQVVCHGVPSAREVLKAGDIINIDITIIKDGYFADTSKMFAIEPITNEARQLLQVTETCLWLGIREVKPGAYLGNIGAVIQRWAKTHSYSIVREYCGHGVGLAFHEPPSVLHYGTSGTGPKLRPGMIFTIEPMLNAGSRKIQLLDDGWTVVTKDRQLSAQYEHTVLVTSEGYEVLTSSRA